MKNFMKTKLYNLRSLYDPNVNFTYEICKIGDNGQAYSKEELEKYKNYYAKKWEKNIFLICFLMLARIISNIFLKIIKTLNIIII